MVYVSVRDLVCRQFKLRPHEARRGRHFCDTEERVEIVRKLEELRIDLCLRERPLTNDEEVLVQRLGDLGVSWAAAPMVYAMDHTHGLFRSIRGSFELTIPGLYDLMDKLYDDIMVVDSAWRLGA